MASFFSIQKEWRNLSKRLVRRQTQNQLDPSIGVRFIGEEGRGMEATEKLGNKIKLQSSRWTTLGHNPERVPLDPRNLPRTAVTAEWGGERRKGQGCGRRLIRRIEPTPFNSSFVSSVKFGRIVVAAFIVWPGLSRKLVKVSCLSPVTRQHAALRRDFGRVCCLPDFVEEFRLGGCRLTRD